MRCVAIIDPASKGICVLLVIPLFVFVPLFLLFVIPPLTMPTAPITTKATTAPRILSAATAAMTRSSRRRQDHHGLNHPSIHSYYI